LWGSEPARDVIELRYKSFVVRDYTAPEPNPVLLWQVTNNAPRRHFPSEKYPLVFLRRQSCHVPFRLCRAENCSPLRHCEVKKPCPILYSPCRKFGARLDMIRAFPRCDWTFRLRPSQNTRGLPLAELLLRTNTKPNGREERRRASWSPDRWIDKGESCGERACLGGAVRCSRGEEIEPTKMSAVSRGPPVRVLRSKTEKRGRVFGARRQKISNGALRVLCGSGGEP